MPRIPHLMIGGPMGSGKNTAWRYLNAKWGHEFVAFANKMKFMAKEIISEKSWSAEDFARKYTTELFGEEGPYEKVLKAMETLLALPCTAEYRMTNEAYPLPDVEYGFEAIDDIFCGHKPRALLQEIGREFRAIRENVWIEYMERVLQRHPDVLFCVCDMRMPLEAEFGRKLGMKIIYIDAGKGLRVDRLVDRDGDCDETKMNDVTETSLDPAAFEHVVVNDGSLEDLHRKLDAAMEAITR